MRTPATGQLGPTSGVESDEPRHKLLLRLLEGHCEGPSVLSAAQRSGFDLGEPHIALAVRPTDGTSASMVSHHLSGLLERPSLLGCDERRVLALVSARGILSEPAKRRFLFRRLHAALEGTNGRIVLAWSCVHSGLPGWRLALDEAQRALSMVRRVLGPGSAAGYAEVSVLSLVLGAHDADDLRLQQERLLGPLFCHDQVDRTDLVATLETYLDTACNARRTAEVLGVHRNSVGYRLQRVRELVEVDLEDADTRLLVQLILRSARGLANKAQAGTDAASLPI